MQSKTHAYTPVEHGRWVVQSVLQGNPNADPKLLAISYHLVNFFGGWLNLHDTINKHQQWI
jgi:hypothetical protein